MKKKILYCSIFFLFFCFIPYKSFSFSLGLGTSFSFNNFYYNSSQESKEKSAFGASLITQIKFQPVNRFLIIPQFDYSYYHNLQSFSVGSHFGFVLHPTYQPFVGFYVKSSYYTTIIDTDQHINFSIGLTLGSKIYQWENHSLSLLLEYLIYQTYDPVSQNAFSLGLIYHYDFDY